jgi:hypothetical protein
VFVGVGGVVMEPDAGSGPAKSIDNSTYCSQLFLNPLRVSSFLQDWIRSELINITRKS